MKYSLKHRNFFTECEADIKNKTLERAALSDLREKFSNRKRGVGGGNHPPPPWALMYVGIPWAGEG